MMPEAEEMQRLIRAECDSIRDTLLEKNANYGNSVLDPVRIFSKADRIEQILVRLDDKLSRLKRGSAAGEDVTLDIVGYLVLLRVARTLQGGEFHEAPKEKSLTSEQVQGILDHLEEMREAAQEEADKRKPDGVDDAMQRIMRAECLGSRDGFSYAAQHIRTVLR